MTNEQYLQQCIDRCEKIEMAGAQSCIDVQDRLNSIRILKDAFKVLRADPPRAYVQFMKVALGQPSTARPEYVNRVALFGRLAGVAMVSMYQSEDVFSRAMAVNERRAD